MKRYALVVSLALLFAAFLWSCQQQNSAPLSPEESITLGKGKPPPKPEPATHTIEVFFGNPAMLGEFISVALTDAVANRKGTAVIANGITTFDLTEFEEYFLASVGDVGCLDDVFLNKDGTPKTTFFDGDLYVAERDGDPYDALGSFSTDDKADDTPDPFFWIFMWGAIEGEDGWLLPTVEKPAPLVVTGNVTNPDPPPGGPDRLGIRVETGKGKNKNVCGGGIENQPWRIVITLN